MRTLSLDFVKSKTFMCFIVFQVSTLLAVGFNVPLLRQLLGFIYLSFVPGLLILKSLRITKKSLTHVVLFSVGLSLASTMSIGLLLNWALPLVGQVRPLSIFSLLLFITVLDFILFFIGKLAGSKNSLFENPIPTFKVNKSLLFIFVIVAFSVFGTIVARYCGNNSLLICGFILICVLFLSSMFGIISYEFFPLVILAIAVALLLQTTLASNYLTGGDIHLEYYLAQTVKNNQYWNYSLMSAFAGATNYNTMLSITILPAIYSTILDLDIFFVYTIIYPLLFSLVPLALYEIYKRHFSSRFAFCSVFFFMSFYVFYITMTYLARQMIAEIFFVLVFLLLFEYEAKSSPRSMAVLLVVFAFSMVISHYSTALICLFYLFFSLVLMRNSTLRCARIFIFLFASILFSWYIFVSNSSVLVTLVDFGKSIITGLQNYFVAQSSNRLIMHALGQGSTSLWVGQISRAIFILTTVLLEIGLLVSLVGQKNRTFSKGFFSFSVAGGFILAATILLPSFSEGLSITRIYQLGISFSAPFVIVGSEFVFNRIVGLRRFLPKRLLTKVSWKTSKLGSALMATLLVVYFVFQSGVVNDLAGVTPTNFSLTMDKSRIVQGKNIGMYDVYTPEKDVFGARWLVNNTNIGTRGTASGPVVFGDVTSSHHVLVSYGMIYAGNIQVLSNTSIIPRGSYIYLRSLNVVYGIYDIQSGVGLNITDVSDKLMWTNIVYSNGGCEVLWATG